MEKENATRGENLEITEEMEENVSAEEERSPAGFSMAAAVLLVVAVLFTVIAAGTNFLGDLFGKGVEIAVLVLIAVILAAILIKDKRKK